MTHKYATIDPSPFSANQQILRMAGEFCGGRECRVLDVGCATGYLAEKLKMLNCRVSGIERSPEAAHEAEKHCEQVWCTDLDQMAPLDSKATFDLLIFADILEHTVDPERNLLKLLPALRPGGRVICSLPNIANWRVRLALLLGRFQYRPIGILDESHLRFFTRRSALAMFERVGLQVRRMSVTPSFLPYRLYRLYAVKWMDFAICRLLPGLGAQQFIFELDSHKS